MYISIVIYLNVISMDVWTSDMNAANPDVTECLYTTRVVNKI